MRDSIVGERYVVDDDAALDEAIVANEPEPRMSGRPIAARAAHA